MKYVRSLLAESARLAEYRANPAAGAQRPASAAKEVWERFRKRAPNAYWELVEELSRRQQGLCLYCEQRLVDEQGALVQGRYQVEHVLSKSGAMGRVLDWTNLALACWGTGFRNDDKSCGAAKANQALPAGCDPRTIALAPSLVAVGTDGRVSADTSACAQLGVSAADVTSAVESVLNLNSERLRKPRQDAGDAVREKVGELLRALVAASVEASEQQRVFDDLIAERLSPDAVGHLVPFWTAERHALGAPAETWLMTNQGQLK